MTDGKILAIAREVGWNTEHRATNDYIVRLAKAIAAHEREQQRAAIDFLTRAYDILKKEVDELHQAQRDQIAAAIRSRT